MRPDRFLEGAVNRRGFLKGAALTTGAAFLPAAGAVLGAGGRAEAGSARPAGSATPEADSWAQSASPGHRWARPRRASDPGPHAGLEEVTIDQIQQAFRAGHLTARDLVLQYQERIEALDRNGPELRTVLELNPDAERIAADLDAERMARGVRGPLHGIPVLIKDNIDTADRMLTTAGSLALGGTRPRQDAGVVRRLREAGAVILGKSNLSEWANIRSYRSSSGWSARGGQCRNPYVIQRNPCGSSSGSAAAVSANLCMAALGTETDGSIVCPSHVNGVVGIKPTVGLTSRAGVVPISHSQDTVGPQARTVRDAAILLGAVCGSDPRDPATSDSRCRAGVDYTRFLHPGGLRGARIGVARQSFFGYSQHTDRVIEEAIALMRSQGAVIVDPADIPNIDEINSSSAELTVLLYELKADLNAYLKTRMPRPGYQGPPPPATLLEIIEFNEAHREEEMAYFGQELFLEAQSKGPLSEAEYREAAETSLRLGRQGIDKALAMHKVDALVAPTGGPAWPTDLINGDHFLGASSSPAAMAGYPLVTVPAGYAFGLPIGLTFMGTAYSEPVLLRLAYAYEHASRFRRAPRYLEALDLSGR